MQPRPKIHERSPVALEVEEQHVQRGRDYSEDQSDKRHRATVKRRLLAEPPRFAIYRDTLDNECYVRLMKPSIPWTAGDQRERGPEESTHAIAPAAPWVGSVWSNALFASIMGSACLSLWFHRRYARAVLGRRSEG